MLISALSGITTTGHMWLLSLVAGTTKELNFGFKKIFNLNNF